MFSNQQAAALCENNYYTVLTDIGPGPARSGPLRLEPGPARPVFCLSFSRPGPARRAARPVQNSSSESYQNSVTLVFLGNVLL